MRVLVVGSGAREHALAWGLAHAPSVREVASAPGNPGMGALGPRHAVRADDVVALAELAAREGFDLVVIGPEAPLTAGLADRLRERGIACFGPSAAAARLEGSKSFAKTLMARVGIPTAPFRVAADVDEALAAVRDVGLPVVLKVDGLAAGKGVRVCRDAEAACVFARQSLVEGRFGAAGRRLVVESFLEGEEVSVFALTDGERVFPLLPARDYKRLAAGDAGPNTGGMGAYAPADLDARQTEEILALAAHPILAALRHEGTPYTGLLYCGIMRTACGPMVLEYNCRFGDPETQAVIPLLASDLGRLLLDCAHGRLTTPPTWAAGACVAVVLAAAGYPDAPRGGDVIRGLEAAAALPGVRIFQAGCALAGGTLVSAGGRVLTVSAAGAEREAARELAYRALGRVELDGAQWRGDIGAAPVAAAGGSSCR